MRLLPQASCILLFVSLAVAACADAPTSPGTSRTEVAAALAPLHGAQSPNVVPDRYLVRFRPTAEKAADIAANVIRGLPGAELLAILENPGGFYGKLPAEALEGVRRNPLVEVVEADMYLYPAGVQYIGSDPPGLWGLDRVDQITGQDGMFQYDANGSGVHIYVLDTGISQISELSGRFGLGVSFGTAQSYDPHQPCHNHGTMVASIAAGTTHGVAKGATVHSFRVAPACDSTSTTGNMSAAINYARNYGTRPAVINISFTGELNCILGFCGNLYEDEIRNAISSGITVVIGAGNSNADACNFTPARVSQAITVAATNSSDQRWVRNTAQGSNFGSCVDIFAPGAAVGVALINGTNTTADGTSLAAPFVTGTAAAWLKQNPSASPAGVWGAIVSAATDAALTNIGSGSPNRFLNSWLPGPPVAQINGPNTAGTFSCSWNATVQSGKAPFTYQWSGVASGTSSSVEATVTQEGYLELSVTDARGRVSSVSRWISVDPQAIACY